MAKNTLDAGFDQLFEKIFQFKRDVYLLLQVAQKLPPTTELKEAIKHVEAWY